MPSSRTIAASHSFTFTYALGRPIVLAAGAGGVVAGTDLGGVVSVVDRVARARSGHRGAVSCVAVGEERLASGGTDGRLRVWTPELELVEEVLHPAPVVGVAFVDELVVSVDAAGGVAFGGGRGVAHEGAVTALLVADDVYTAGLDGAVIRWSRRGERLGEVARATVAIDALAVDGSRVAFATAAGEVMVDGATVLTLRRDDVAVHALASTGVGFVAATSDGFLHRLADGARWAVGSGAFPVVFETDVAFVGVEGGLRGLRLRDGAFVGGYAPVGGVGIGAPKAIASSGDELLASYQSIDVWPRGAAAVSEAHVGYVAWITLLEDGRVVTAGNDGAVAVRDPDSLGGRVWAAHGSRCTAVAVGPNGVIATGGRQDVACWDAEGRELGRWPVAAHALTWHPDGRLLFAGDRVRLGWIRLGAGAPTVVREGPPMLPLRLELGEDGRVLTRTRGEGVWIDLETGASDTVKLEPITSEEPTVITGAGRKVVASREGDLAFDEAPSIRPVEATQVVALEGEAPALPEVAGPAWLRGWLEEASDRGYERRAELVARLARSERGVPPAAVLAWACRVGSGTVRGTQFGLGLFNVQDQTSEGQTLVAWSWPRRYVADADGRVEVDDSRATRPRGDLHALLLSLALDDAMAQSQASLHVRSDEAPGIADALGLDALEGVTGWWAGPDARLDAGDGEARLASTKVGVLAAGLAAVTGSARLSLRDHKPKPLPLDDAPELPTPSGHALLGAHPEQQGHLEVRTNKKKVALHQVVGRGGRVVEELSFAGSAKGCRFVLVTEATPLPLSPRSRRFLARQKATRDPLHSASRETLLALLVARGLPAHPVVLDLEEALGGLALVDPGDPEQRAQLGAYRLLATWPEGWLLGEEDREAGLVAVGHLFGDEMLALDGEGRVFWQEMVAMPRMCLVADDVVTFVERWLLELASPRESVCIAGRHGASLARSIEAELVKEASDGHERWWLGDGLAIVEPLPYDHIVNGTREEPSTVVRLAKGRLPPRVGEALVGLGAKATTESKRVAGALRKLGLG